MWHRIPLDLADLSVTATEFDGFWDDVRDDGHEVRTLCPDCGAPMPTRLGLGECDACGKVFVAIAIGIDDDPIAAARATLAAMKADET